MNKILLSVSLLCGCFNAFAQPEIVKDLNPGTSSSMASTNDMQTMYAAGKIFFIANDGTLTGNDRYYVTDGTAANTELLVNINADLSRIVEFNGKGYFLASHHLNNGGAIELWETDGTPSGTVLVTTVGTASSSTWMSQNDIFAGGNGVYFYADETVYGKELWFSDGTAVGTDIVAELFPGSSDGYFSDEAYYFNNLFYFSYYNGTETTLAVTDGTPSGTQDWSISGIPTSLNIDDVRFFIEMNNKLYFSVGEFLIESDGTENGTHWIYSGINLNDPNDTLVSYANSTEAQPVVMNGEFYFVGVAVADGNEINDNMLFKSDGTPGGTKMVKDINAESTVTFAANGNQVFFIGKETATTGKEIWTTDGTEGGTRLLKDIDPGTQNGVSSPIISVGNYVCFVGDGPAHGKELWQYDVTNNITVLVADIHQGINSIFNTPNSSNPRDIINGGGTLYFRATENSTYGSELWKYTPYYIADTATSTGTAPAQPSNLTATPTNSILLDWQDNANNEDGFKVEYATDAAGPWTEIADLGVDVVTYTHTGLTDGIEYFYRVKAYNGSGESSYSNVASAVEGSNTVLVDEILFENSIAYPNPTSGQINFGVQTNAKLTNASGQVIATQTNTSSLDLTMFPAGIYYLTLSKNNGEVLQHTKIVKK